MEDELISEINTVELLNYSIFLLRSLPWSASPRNQCHQSYLSTLQIRLITKEVTRLVIWVEAKTVSPRLPVLPAGFKLNEASNLMKNLIMCKGRWNNIFVVDSDCFIYSLK